MGRCLACVAYQEVRMGTSTLVQRVREILQSLGCLSALLLVIPNAGDEHTTVLHALVRRDRAPAPGQSDAIALGPDAEGWSSGARENRMLTPVWKAVVGVFGIEFHAGLGWQRAHACHSSRSRLWSDMFLVR